MLILREALKEGTQKLKYCLKNNTNIQRLFAAANRRTNTRVLTDTKYFKTKLMNESASFLTEKSEY